MRTAPTAAAQHPLGPYYDRHKARAWEMAMNGDDRILPCHWRLTRKTRERMVFLLDAITHRDIAPADVARSMRITEKVLRRIIMILRYRYLVPIRYSSARHVYRRLDEPHRDAALLLASRIIADDKRYTAPFQDVEHSTKYFL
jgi:hypothetical protein